MNKKSAEAGSLLEVASRKVVLSNSSPRYSGGTSEHLVSYYCILLPVD
jgi:hypothetical protein